MPHHSPFNLVLVKNQPGERLETYLVSTVLLRTSAKLCDLLLRAKWSEIRYPGRMMELERNAIMDDSVLTI